MEELGGKGREEGGGERVGAPFNVLPPGATDLVAPLSRKITIEPVQKLYLVHHNYLVSAEVFYDLQYQTLSADPDINQLLFHYDQDTAKYCQQHQSGQVQYCDFS